MPQAFVREVRGGDKGHAVTNGDISSFQPSQNGRFDDAILCGPCDNALGKDEKYAVETLSAIRRSAPHAVNEAITVDDIDGDRLLRFAAGIAWKYSQTRPEYGRIDIGPYAAILSGMLFNGGDGGGAVDAFLMKLHSGDDEPYFYRAPSCQRNEGLNFVRLSAGGFVFLLKIDRRTPSKLPVEGWLRGRSSILIPAIPFNQLEEGRMVLGARKQNNRLDAYLNRVTVA
ncbi:hypothetical protein [Rhizorhabdus wittichii]|uniref:hypothetical protein n=1 Tax=Rhizorhabdus wittichii TaxID=160791 RepID=UPI0003791050|nr:hypothetical protein [Rhizorhabdus wittichii]